jgi:hypothetical protein
MRTVMTSPTDDQTPPSERCIGVTVRTPAGASRAFAVEPGDTAGQLTIRALNRFERDGLVEGGSYRIGLLRGTSIIDLAVDSDLGDAGVAEGDVLHLISTEPQVDGVYDVLDVLDRIRRHFQRTAA